MNLRIVNLEADGLRGIIATLDVNGHRLVIRVPPEPASQEWPAEIELPDAVSERLTALATAFPLAAQALISVGLPTVGAVTIRADPDARGGWRAPVMLSQESRALVAALLIPAIRKARLAMEEALEARDDG